MEGEKSLSVYGFQTDKKFHPMQSDAQFSIPKINRLITHQHPGKKVQQSGFLPTADGISSLNIKPIRQIRMLPFRSLLIVSQGYLRTPAKNIYPVRCHLGSKHNMTPHPHPNFQKDLLT